MSQTPILKAIACAGLALTLLTSCATKYSTETQYLYPPKPKSTPVPKMIPSKSSVKSVPKPTPTPKPKAKPTPLAKPAPSKPKPTPKPKATPKLAPKITPVPKVAEPTPKPVLKLEPFLPVESTAPGRKPTPTPKPQRKAAPKQTPVPSQPVSNSEETSVAREGDFLIQYREGAITKVLVKKKTGDRGLDKRSVEWIWAKFRVRKGATGESLITLNWDGSYERPTPRFY